MDHLRRLLALILTVAVTSTLAVLIAPAAGADDEDGDDDAPIAAAWGDDSTGEGRRALDAGGRWRAADDLGSLYTVNRLIGAHDVWRMPDPNARHRTLTGHGIGVAVIDTGIAPVPGLDAPGKVVNGPDLSFESQAAGTRYLDGFGHGTHMAGIIAGRDGDPLRGGDGGAGRPGTADPGVFAGVAPDATLVNVKVATADGGTDVSQVIAAIDWVVQNRRQHNIRVLNLSYGTQSGQDPRQDPLAHAVQNAWRAGIVVVVAAGNGGEAGATTLTMPAVDPYVLAVGSSDHRGGAGVGATVVGAWTNDGTPGRRPDLVAPGKSLVSLRVPGGLADVTSPEGRVGHGHPRFFRGTGTSQSAAVVSGAVALLLQRAPSLTPDQVKWLLRTTADPLTARGARSDATQGAGLLDIDGAVARVDGRGLPRPSPQAWPASTGLGTLEGSRGGSHVADPATGVVLTGEQDIFGVRWDARAWATDSARQRAWQGGSWRGSPWTGSSWVADPWQRRSWAHAAWTRRSLAGESWAPYATTGMDFSGRSWASDDWQRRSWAADSWARRSWAST